MGRPATGRSLRGPVSPRPAFGLPWPSHGGGRAPLGLRPPYAAPSGTASTTPVAGLGVRDARLARVEAVLFLAEVPINTRKISQFANLADGTEARTLIRRLNEWYDRRGSAFRAEEVAGGFQLLTRRKFAGWLRRLVRTHVETRLSTPALETLAVAAYRQPVTRAEIESIRGVQCDEMLRQLMERDLLKIVGRSDELGRPFLYGTTRRFLQYFGLRHLDELPRAEVLRADRADTQPEVSTNSSIEESAVKIAADTDLAREEELERRRLPWADEIRAADEDDDDDFEEEDEDEDEEDDDADDEDDEEDEDFEDEDFDDDWEEVDDEEGDEDEEDEDEDWDDEDEDEDDDWDDDEEEEEEDDE